MNPADTYVGCDPGLGGALAIWRPSDEMLLAIDMPTPEINGKTKIDLYKLGSELRASASITRIVRVTVKPLPGGRGPWAAAPR